jgi:hypothetical protein
MAKTKKLALLFLIVYGSSAFSSDYSEVDKFDDYYSHIAKKFFKRQFKEIGRDFDGIMEVKKKAQEHFNDCNSASPKENFSCDRFIIKYLNEEELTNYLVHPHCYIPNSHLVPKNDYRGLWQCLDGASFFVPVTGVCTGSLLGGLWTGLGSFLGPPFLYAAGGFAAWLCLYWPSRAMHFYFGDWQAMKTIKDDDIKGIILAKAKLLAEESKATIEERFFISQ